MAIAVLLTSGFFLRFIFYTGPVGSDDANYFHFGQKLWSDQRFTELNHQGGRLFFLLSVGTIAVWLNHVHFGAIANVLLLSARDVALTIFAFRMRGLVPAAFCAATLSLNPVSTTYAGLMMPDGLLSLMMVASSMVAYKAIGSTSGSVIRLGALAGGLAALAYSTKETGILVVPPTLLGFWWWCRGSLRVRAITSYGLTAILCAGLDMLAYWGISGDLLYRLHAISVVHNATVVPAASPFEFARSGYWNLATVVRPLSTSLPVLILLLLVVGVALVDRTRRALFPLTGAFVAIYLVFGTSSVTRLMPMQMSDRYFEAVVPYVALSIAIAVGMMMATRQVLFARILVLFASAMILLGAPSVAHNAGDIVWSTWAKNTVLAIRLARDRYPNLDVYVSKGMRVTLEPFMEPADYRTLKDVPADRPLPRGLYVLNPRRDSEFIEINAYREIAAMPATSRVDLDYRLGRFLRAPAGNRTAVGEVRIKAND